MSEPIDSTNLCEILPEVVAARLAHGGFNVFGDLKHIGHREILLVRNCGWGTVKQIQIILADHGVDWPGYAIPFPRRSGKPRPSSPARFADGFVYLAKTTTHRLTKIGFSIVPEVREATLQGEDPYLHLVHAVRASSSFERWLHTRFATARIRGEWFNLGRQDIEWITTGRARSEFARDQDKGEDHAQDLR